MNGLRVLFIFISDFLRVYSSALAAENYALVYFAQFRRGHSAFIRSENKKSTRAVRINRVALRSSVSLA